MISLTPKSGLRQLQLVALGVTLAATALFVWVGSAAVTQTFHVVRGMGRSDEALAMLLLANIALIFCGWLRYHRLTLQLAAATAAEQEARRLADIDPLTGCLNRRSLLPAIEQMLAANGLGDRKLVVFVIDLDNFKQINDRHGHEVGDLVLTGLASRLRSVLSNDYLLARLGGDEFACVAAMPLPFRQMAEELAQRLVQAVAEGDADRPAGTDLPLTMSMGLATADLNSSERPGPTTLLRQADVAMYRAKRQGKNRFIWFEPRMLEEMELRRALEQSVHAGLAAREFVPYYEQQIDLATGRLVGFEMLARWRSLEHGTLLPDLFIPVAEDMGLIASLSEQLISQALKDAGDWDSSLTLSVNISPLQLQDPWFAQRILKLLTEHNFPPSRLDLEITESSLHQNLEEVRAILLSLRNQGIKITLDDFGNGYAGLNQLRDLQFDQFKIDRSLVSSMTQNEANRTIVDTVVELGRALRLPVTAEGVEDQHIEAALKKQENLKAQGYLYGRPESAAAVRERLGRLGLLRSQVAEPEEAVLMQLARAG